MLNGFSKRFPVTSYTKENMQKIEKEANELLNEKLHALPLSAFMIYEKTGDREVYEQLYINYRKRLFVFLAMAMWSDDEKWVTAVEDTVWAICDTVSWEVPAHFPLPVKFSECRTKIGLFAAETALSLCETLYLLEDRLSDIVKDRIRHEVRERVIEPYCKDDYDWSMKWGADNWSAVCGGSCGMVVMYLGTKAETEIAIQKTLKCVDMFLSSYKEDGACLEGPLYWEYGFGFFCMFAAMLKEYTNGGINLFDNEKIEKIARFGENIYLDKNKVIPFADTAHEVNFNLWLFSFLEREYGVQMPDLQYAANPGDDKRYRIPFFLRTMFMPQITMGEKQKKNDLCIYRDSQWYIKRNKNYILAAKGGSNDEPHNHNDVGGFVLMSKGEVVLDDMGWGDYVKGYFTEKRYDYLCASSFGHSVPSVNGKGQLAGGDKKAVLLAADETEFSLDLSAAYDENVKITRSFVPEENCLKIKDTFSGENREIRERFVTFFKPQIKNDAVCVGDISITASCANAVKCEVSSTEYVPRQNIIIATPPKRLVYFIDYIINEPDENTEIEFSIRP